MRPRRQNVTNATVFVTQVVQLRHSLFASPLIVSLLLDNMRRTKQHHPFNMLAYVILPDHLHMLIRVGNSLDLSDIMRSIKTNFTIDFKRQRGIAGSLKVWQKSFWDHVIRDDADLRRHIDYIHYNPVHHELVERPEQWPHSSYLQWCEKGCYAPQWGWSLPDTVHMVPEWESIPE